MSIACCIETIFVCVSCGDCEITPTCDDTGNCRCTCFSCHYHTQNMNVCLEAFAWFQVCCCIPCRNLCSCSSSNICTYVYIHCLLHTCPDQFRSLRKRYPGLNTYPWHTTDPSPPASRPSYLCMEEPPL